MVTNWDSDTYWAAYEWLRDQFVVGKLYQMSGAQRIVRIRTINEERPYFLWKQPGVIEDNDDNLWVMFLGSSFEERAADWIIVLHMGQIWHVNPYAFELHLIETGVIEADWHEQFTKMMAKDNDLD